MSKKRSLPLLLLAMILTASAPRVRAGDSWTVWADPSRVRAFAVDGEGVWAGGRGGLVRLTPATGDVEAVTTAEGLAGIDVMDLLMLDGELWVATATEGLQRYRSGDAEPWFRFQTFPQGLASDALRCLSAGPSGGVWYGSDKGYGLIADGEHQRLWNELNGLANADVRALAFAGDTLLVGTAAGLYRMDPGANPALEPGAPTSAITDIAVAADSVWVLAGEVIVRDRLEGSGNWPELMLPAGGVSVSGLGAADGALYVVYELATNGNTITDANNDRVARYEPGQGWTDLSATLPSSFYPTYSSLTYDALLAADGNTLWLGGTIADAFGPGILHFAGTSWEQFLLDRSPMGWEQLAMAMSPSGAVWANSNSGAARFADGVWTRYPRGSGPGGTPRFCLDALEDSQGWVWLNWWAHGFGRLELATGTTELVASGSNCVSRMLEDANGNRWFCRDRDGGDVMGGVDVYTADDTWVHFDQSQGLPGLTIDGMALLSPTRNAFLFRSAGLYIWDHAGTLANQSDDDWWSVGSGVIDDDGLLDPGTQGFSLAAGFDGGLWIGQDDGLVRVVRADSGYRVVTRLGAKTSFTEGLLGVSIKDVAAAPDGSVWVGTDLGLTHADLTIEDSGGQELLRWTVQSYTNEAGREQAGTDLYGVDVLAPLCTPILNRVRVSPDGSTIWLAAKPGIMRLTISPDVAPDPSLVDAAWIYPNPARLSLGHQAVRLGGMEQPVTATVYNLEGQLVKESGTVEPGGVLWDLTTRFGSRAVSGVYILRLETEGHVALRELVVVR